MTDVAAETPVDPIASRQQEVAQYESVIGMYETIQATLPSEWPAHLVQFKDRPDRHAAVAEIEDLDDVTLISELWAHDDARAAVRSNMVEKAKSQAILNALIAQQG